MSWLVVSRNLFILILTITNKSRIQYLKTGYFDVASWHFCPLVTFNTNFRLLASFSPSRVTIHATYKLFVHLLTFFLHVQVFYHPSISLHLHLVSSTIRRMKLNKRDEGQWDIIRRESYEPTVQYYTIVSPWHFYLWIIGRHAIKELAPNKLSGEGVRGRRLSSIDFVVCFLNIPIKSGRRNITNLYIT